MAQPPRPAVTKTAPPPLTKKITINETPLFGKSNLMLMVTGAVIIIVGMLLMSGGRSSDPKVFDYNQVYSKTRITVAPILIIIGILIEVFAIFRQPRTTA